MGGSSRFGIGDDDDDDDEYREYRWEYSVTETTANNTQSPPFAAVWRSTTYLRSSFIAKDGEARGRAAALDSLRPQPHSKNNINVLPQKHGPDDRRLPSFWLRATTQSALTTKSPTSTPRWRKWKTVKRHRAACVRSESLDACSPCSLPLFCSFFRICQCRLWKGPVADRIPTLKSDNHLQEHQEHQAIKLHRRMSQHQEHMTFEILRD